MKQQSVRELILYTLFGVGTVLVDLGLYAVLVDGVGIPAANAMSWLGAVLFAFFTNKYFVFETPQGDRREFLREFVTFLGARLLSFLVEVVGVDALVQLGLDRPMFGVTGGVSKCLVTVVVVGMNYLLSKFFVFRKKGDAP